MGAASGEIVAERELIARGRLSRELSAHYVLVLASALFGWLMFLAVVLPIDADEAVYHLIAKGMLAGKWPYRDLFDHKTPLIYVWHLPGALGAGIMGERAIAAIMCAASVPVMASLARKHLANERQVVFAVVSFVAFLACPYLGVNANTEAFSLLPLMLAVAAPTAIIAGLLLGVATMTKVVALAFVPVFVLMWGRRFTLVAAGWALVVVVVSLPFMPIWREYLDANIGFNMTYSDQFTPWDRLRVFLIPHPLLVLSALPVWIAAIYGTARERRPLFLVWGACGYLAAKTPGYDFTHYYILLAPPLALLAGQGFDAYLARRPFRLVSPLAVWAAFSAAIVFIVSAASITERDGYEEFAESHSLPGGELYVLGHFSDIYVYSDREPQRRYFFSVPLSVDERLGQKERAALLACLPDVVVVPERSLDLYPLRWATEIEAQYRSRQDYDGGFVLTDPLATCADPSVRDVR